MMVRRYAKIIDGVVAHISIALRDEDAPGCVPLDDATDAGIGLGDLYDGAQFSKPPPPEKSPEDLAREAQQAALREYAGAVKTLPAIQFLANNSPADCQQFVHNQVAAADATTQAQLKAAVVKLEGLVAQIAAVLSVLAHREYRD